MLNGNPDSLSGAVFSSLLTLGLSTLPGTRDARRARRQGAIGGQTSFRRDSSFFFLGTHFGKLRWGPSRKMVTPRHALSSARGPGESRLGWGWS